MTVVSGQGAAPATSTGIQTISTCWEFAHVRTQSGRSLGSLEHYNMEWSAADTGEVTSQHPASPSLLAQKMFAVKTTVMEADKVAQVNSAE